MPDAFECPVVIGDQGGKRTPDTRISNPLVGMLTGACRLPPAFSVPQMHWRFGVS
jgi:hypothetical protein